MALGKLENGVLKYAPSTIVVDNVIYNPATETILRSVGYKDIVYGTMPTAPTDYHYTSRWVDGEQITQAFDLEEDTVATKVANRKQWLNDTDWVVIKIAEGAATKEEYADEIAQRVAWRAFINEHEN